MRMSILPYTLAKGNQKRLDDLSIRVMVFAIPDVIEEGVQAVDVMSMFYGKIIDVTANCRVAGSEDTTITIQRTSDIESDVWEDVVTTSITANRKVNNSVTILDSKVSLGDYFRVTVDEVGEGLENLTINVLIEQNRG